MLRNAVITYSERLANVTYGENHPFVPYRATLFLEHIRRYSLLDEKNDRIVDPKNVDEEVLLLFHDKEYLDILKSAEHKVDATVLFKGLGTEDNPIFSGMFDFALGAVSSTFFCFEGVSKGESSFSFNPIGGFHHALKDRAMGFCYLNDVAICGRYFSGNGKRFVILDIDAHHGNGTQDAFYEDDSVLTISIHESGMTLFPGTGSETELGRNKGYGYNVNIPLPSGSDDDVYLFAFDEVVLPIIRAFSPDFLVALIGGDAHKDDPFSHINLTVGGYKKIFERVNELSQRIVALGAGGYNMSRTPLIWTVAYSVFTGRPLEDQFAGIVGGMMYGPETDIFELLHERHESKPELKAQCMSVVERTVKFLKGSLSPIFGPF